ncbi:MAG: UDP-N-acetylglucosamine--N-acetylmuramyl-(pentapeptide) pyrophosphoryl-undecaprenol N-acetylglucosamine transferase [candidate division WOR-3 bacterium]
MNCLKKKLNTEKRRLIFIVIAGTGGHIFPGIALAEGVKERGEKVLLLGRRGGMEEKIAKESGFDFWGYAFFKRLFSINLVYGVVQCFCYFWRNKPKVVIACGSYASLPPILAGIALCLPIYLLEQNRMPGKMTKVFASFARLVFLGFPPPRKIKNKEIWSGNPIRKAIRMIKEIKEENILILGGSQGARFLSLFFKDLAQEFPEEKFLIQVREEDFEKIRDDTYQNCSFFVFTPNIAEILAKTKLVVSRAGASTISEILYLGLPVILIPYPYAAQNHQEWNARFCVERGCAIMIKEDDFVKNQERVKRVIKSFILDKERREEMRRKAEKIKKDGTKIILDILGIGREHERSYQ